MRFIFALFLYRKLFCKLHHPAQILADNIEFQIDNTTYMQCMEIGMLVRIRDDGYLEGIFRRIADRQADSVYRNRTLVDCKIATLCHFRIKSILEGEIPASFRTSIATQVAVWSTCP